MEWTASLVGMKHPINKLEINGAPKWRCQRGSNPEPKRARRTLDQLG